MDDGNPHVKPSIQEGSGRLFLEDDGDDDQCLRYYADNDIVNKEDKVKRGEGDTQVVHQVQNSTINDILCYNEFTDFMEQENNEIVNDTGQLLKFYCITAFGKETGGMSMDLDKKTDISMWNNLEETTPSLRLWGADTSSISHRSSSSILRHAGSCQYIGEAIIAKML